jgi:hypothetical protein
MLKVAPIFTCANEAFAEFGDHLRVKSLPIVVYLMQRDVINHYRHALTHYFPVSLSEPYLQNSSIGPPYEKWRKFANENFDLLSFALNNLMRYTSRFGHETICVALENQNRHREIKRLSDEMLPDFTSVLCDVNRGRQIGIEILEDNSLNLTPFAYPLAPNRIEIGDRSVLQSLCEQGHSEVEFLKVAHRTFAQQVNKYNAGKTLAHDFDAMNESWWV